MSSNLFKAVPAGSSHIPNDPANMSKIKKYFVFSFSVLAVMYFIFEISNNIFEFNENVWSLNDYLYNLRYSFIALIIIIIFLLSIIILLIRINGSNNKNNFEIKYQKYLSNFMRENIDDLCGEIHGAEISLRHTWESVDIEHYVYENWDCLITEKYKLKCSDEELIVWKTLFEGDIPGTEIDDIRALNFSAKTISGEHKIIWFPLKFNGILMEYALFFVPPVKNKTIEFEISLTWPKYYESLNKLKTDEYWIGFTHRDPAMDFSMKLEFNFPRNVGEIRAKAVGFADNIEIVEESDSNKRIKFVYQNGKFIPHRIQNRRPKIYFERI